MSRERSLCGKEEIIKVAIDIVDREGMEALSARRIAKELGVSSMTIYNYVKNLNDVKKRVLIADSDFVSVTDSWEDKAIWNDGIDELLDGIVSLVAERTEKIAAHTVPCCFGPQQRGCVSVCDLKRTHADVCKHQASHCGTVRDGNPHTACAGAQVEQGSAAMLPDICGRSIDEGLCVSSGYQSVPVD